MKKTRSIVLCLAFSLLATQSAQAKLTSEELKSAIQKDKVFAADSKFTARLNGTELVVSTYRADEATDNDCKIDAALAANAAIGADSGLTRITVLFYDTRNADQYLEVPVTIGDIVAYRAGQISKEQLLAALKPIKHGAASASSRTASPLAAVQRNPEPTVVRQSAAPRYNGTVTPLNTRYGFSLDYPADWQIDFPNSGNTLARWTVKTGADQPSIAELRIWPKGTAFDDVADANPQIMFKQTWQAAVINALPGQYQDKLFEFMKNHEENERRGGDGSVEVEGERHHWQHQAAQWTPVSLPSALTVGRSKQPGTQRAYWAKGYITREYVRFVLFKSQGYLVMLCMLAPPEDAANSSASLDRLLSTVVVAAAPKAAKK